MRATSRGTLVAREETLHLKDPAREGPLQGKHSGGACCSDHFESNAATIPLADGAEQALRVFVSPFILKGDPRLEVLVHRSFRG